MINSYAFRRFKNRLFFILCLACVIIAVIPLFFGLRSLRINGMSLISRKFDKTCQYLLKFGTPEFVLEDINVQLKTLHIVFGPLHLTDNWLIYKQLHDCEMHGCRLVSQGRHNPLLQFR